MRDTFPEEMGVLGQSGGSPFPTFTVSQLLRPSSEVDFIFSKSLIYGLRSGESILLRLRTRGDRESPDFFLVQGRRVSHWTASGRVPTEGREEKE